MPAARWRAIGLSAMIPTLVTAGAGGSPVGPAITWEDSRAEPQAGRLRECFSGALAGPGGPAGPGGDALYAVTGQWVDGRYLLPMFLRLIEDDPARAAATTMLLGAKDYVFGWLTGQVATDPSTAAGFGCFALGSGTWDRAALGGAAAAAQAAWPGQARGAALPRGSRGAGGATRQVGAAGGAPGPRFPALPPVLPSATTRPLRPEIAARLRCAQVPVSLGAADSVLGALGLGVTSPGQIAYVAGTSTVMLGISATPALDPRHRFLVTPLAVPGAWGLEMDLLATGSALRWLAGLLGGGLDEAGLLDLAARTDPADAPVVLPYLSPGEQGALWDPSLHGLIAGLTLAHDRRHLARGLVNGIILESRRCLAVLDETGPFGRDLLVAGGSAAAASFRADLADATGRRVIAPATSRDADYSARGAALLAAGATELPPAAAPAAAPPARDPDPARRRLWDGLWRAHDRALQAVLRAG